MNTPSLKTPHASVPAPVADSACPTLSAPHHLRCELRPDPLGIDELQPRVSWRLNDSRRGAAQTAFQVVVASELELLQGRTADLWDSGKIDSDQSVAVTYAGRPLVSRQRCWWRVRVWDQAGEMSAWSEPACWEMGLLCADDWSAHWIGANTNDATKSGPCPHMRREWRIDKPVAKARLYATARGLFGLELNGKRVGHDELAPGWTDYHKRLMYLTYDITDELHSGENVIGAILGDGWYCGHMLWESKRNLYGEQPSLLLQIEVEFEDGTSQTIRSDENWRTSDGPILASDLYNGEEYDARLEMPGWSSPGFDASGWSTAAFAQSTSAQIVAKRNETVQVIEELTPVAMTEPEEGVYVFDLGQNMVGRARLRLRGESGQQITLRFAEMLNDDGTVYVENLRTAKATDRYTFRGHDKVETDGVDTNDLETDVEIWEPRFTFHGFRYVELTGCTTPPDITAVTGIVLHSNMPHTGHFECSHPKINRLQKNILWGQKGNFLDVPTDCPQRDERLGWTGDAQVFVRTAAFNMDVSAFFEKWGFDVVDAQTSDGAFTHIAPDILGVGGSAGWADAGVLCPWTIYLCFGQKKILEQNFEPMLHWIEYQKRTSHELIRPSEGYGDWLAIDAVEPGRAPTPIDLIGTAYFAHTTRITARIARILGKSEEAQRLEQLADQIREAFNRQFVTPGGRVVGHTQTGYLIALGFDLLPEDLVPTAVDHLVHLIEIRDWHLSTGFLGTPLLLPVLTRFGRTDVAYRLIQQETYPSWLYPGEQGATTMWERWNSYTKADGFGDVNMNSFNHYAFGAVGEWLYATVGGIDLDPQRPGYQHAIIRPDPGTAAYGLQWAKADLETPYGKLHSHWTIDGKQFTLHVTIPPNATATVHLPAVGIESVQESGRPLESAVDLHGVISDKQARTVRCEVGAGSYVFVSQGLDGLA